MAVSSSKVYFYNSDNGDRVYDADSFSDWLSKFFTTGVFQNDLYVQAMTGMNVMVNTGYCNIKGKVRDFDEVQELTISPAHSQYPRIDAIVIERNDTDRDITVKYVQGQISGATPSAPTMQRNTLVYQICLAQIYVNAGVTSITQANITDTRPDANLCGWVMSTVNELDITQIMEQNRVQFDEWFENAKGQLDSDAAGHLQNEIDDIVDDLDWKVLDVTLASASWSSDQYTVSNSALTLNKVKFLSVPTSITDAQREAISSANIVPIAEAEGSITLKAIDDAPSIDVPIQIIIGNGQIGG